MHTAQKLTDQIYWVGVNDRRLARFENLFPLPTGVSYNAYLIVDEKTALMDTVEFPFAAELFEKMDSVLAGKAIDYLVVTHMEPDHASAIEYICEKYPGLQVVGNAKMLQLIGQFFDFDISGRFLEVKEGDTLSLGRHELEFFTAPMVHWPEVMFAYEKSEKVLFSADAFGTFGALNGNLFADQYDFDNLYLDEARRYYANIVGKYGPQVQAVMKKAATKQIEIIASLHGPVWRQNLDVLLGKYDLWSRYAPEKQGVVIAYGSMYGNTEAAANILADLLSARGVVDIRMHDISKTHTSYVIGDIFKYSHLVLAAPTYNMGIYLPMHALLHDIAALNLQNRKAALVGNGSWAPVGLDLMRKAVEELKDFELVAEPFLVRSALKAEQMPTLKALADAVAEGAKA